jgi:hypothetical protein
MGYGTGYASTTLVLSMVNSCHVDTLSACLSQRQPSRTPFNWVLWEPSELHSGTLTACSPACQTHGVGPRRGASSKSGQDRAKVLWEKGLLNWPRCRVRSPQPGVAMTWSVGLAKTVLLCWSFINTTGTRFGFPGFYGNAALGKMCLENGHPRLEFWKFRYPVTRRIQRRTFSFRR